MCFPVWVAFAMSVSLLHFWPLILQGNLCPPSTFNLFLVFLLFFWCCMKGFLKCLLALGVESLNKSKAYPNSFPALVTFDLCEVERKVESFFSGERSECSTDTVSFLFT